jgi:AbrB family looped-hinge helix DNA binding protein
VVIPAEYRRELGLRVGDEVIVRLDDGEVRILSRSDAVRRAQALVRRHVRKGSSLVNELLKERRRESSRE